MAQQLISQRECMFCHSVKHMVEVHSHYHCTRCGRANWECCDGLAEQSVTDDEPEILDWHFDEYQEQPEWDEKGFWPFR